MIDLNRMYTVADIVELLGVHEESVRRWLRDGDLHGYMLGRKGGYRVSGQDLQEFLEKRSTGKAVAA